ncbi:biotin transporter BioY [uncultured Vagococcus sp.]|uniref:biotin transporter BioY n=1 Tax=uncultured Vagococcus sp. TaxID=189676 RepID=UPI0028D650B0|nr:biotin transporter BioY [uncultured Vagococcus sp.]
MRNKQLKQLIINAQFAVVIGIIAQFTIPLGIVPLTGQTFAIGIVATILSPINSTIAVLVYLLMGIIGLPVFAGFSSGISILFGPTGGYLVGFIFNTLVTGFILQKTRYTPFWAILANSVGALVTLFFGTMWLKIAADMTWTVAINSGFTAFIIPGIIKAVAAAFVGLFVRNALIKARIVA